MAWFNAGLSSSGGGGGGGSSSHNYSTNEQVIGTWIDGSTVYEKTVAFTTPNSSSYTRQSLGLAIANISKIWIFDGFAMKNGEFVNIGSYNSYPDSHEFLGLIQDDGTNMTFDYRVGTAIYQAPAYVVVRYTKTT